jgi:hypothetical protein
MPAVAITPLTRILLEIRKVASAQAGEAGAVRDDPCTNLARWVAAGSRLPHQRQ